MSETFPPQPSPSPDPATVFQSLATMLYSSGSFEDVYQSVSSLAPVLVPGCDHASIMLRQGTRFATVAASDDIARRVDQLEREVGRGPCLDAIEDDAGQLDADIERDSQWPDLAVRVLAETPVRGMAGFRLLVDDRKVGALNLFSDVAESLTRTSVDSAIMLASFASVALMAVSRQESAQSLRQGLESNREIGKAIGLLMAFHKVHDDEAFALLRRASQDMNIKISEVAREVIQHHSSRPPTA